jgi:hypothetical protein
MHSGITGDDQYAYDNLNYVYAHALIGRKSSFSV